MAGTPTLISSLPCACTCSRSTACSTWGLSAVLDAFQTANELIEVAGLAVPRFDVRVVGRSAGAVKTSQGLGVPVQPVGGRGPRLRRRAGHRVQDAWPARGRARPTPTSATRRSATRLGRAAARR